MLYIKLSEKDAVRPCVLHCFPCSVLQCFPPAVFSHHQRATIGHNMPKYAKIGHKGPNNKKNKKKQRFLETVGIGGMSLVFLFFCFFFVFFGFFFFCFFCFVFFGGFFRPQGKDAESWVFSCPKGRMQRVESCHLFFFLPVNAYVKTENV